MNLAAHPTRPPRPTPVGTWSRILEDAAAVHYVAVPYPFAHIMSSGLPGAPLLQKDCSYPRQSRIKGMTPARRVGPGGGILLRCRDTNCFCLSSCDAVMATTRPGSIL